MKTYEEPDIDFSCINCIHFFSFKDAYEDDMEPWEYGWCVNEENDNEKDLDAGIEISCNKFERII